MRKKKKKILGKKFTEKASLSHSRGRMGKKKEEKRKKRRPVKEREKMLSPFIK